MVSDKEQVKRIKEFKRFCRKNRLRLRESEDGLPVARSIGKWKTDELYCSFEERSVGLYVARETPNQFTFLCKKLIKMQCEPLALGEFDGCFRVSYWDIPPVAKHLKIVKGKAKVANPSWLRKKANAR